MLRVRVAASFLVIILMAVLTSQVALGSTVGPPKMVVLLIDRDAVGRTSGGVNLVQSLVGLSSSLQGDYFFMYASADDPSTVLGPVHPEDQDFGKFKRQIGGELNSPPVSSHWDLAESLASVYNRLVDEGAAPGSMIYLVSGGPSPVDLSELASVPRPIVSLLAEHEWPIVGLSLPGTPQEAIRELSQISLYTGGDAFELSVPTGLAKLADNALTSEAWGSLEVIAPAASYSDDASSSDVLIAPGTSEATFLLFRQATYGSLTLIGPSDLEASDEDFASAKVIESPHVVIWRLADPKPGVWKVGVKRLSDGASIWQSTLNKYSVVLEKMEPVPLGQPTTVIASIRDNGLKAIPEGDVRIRATVESPGGGAATYLLNDRGRNGDSVAGDGFFSATIQATAKQGDHLIKLEADWPEYGHRIASEATLSSRVFPSIELTTLEIDYLKPGERTAVAELSVRVGGQAYAVPVENLASSLTANVGQRGTVEVEPRDVTSSNEAWLYDVFFTPAEVGRHTLIFHLETEYAGRQYRFSSNSFVLQSSPTLQSFLTPSSSTGPVAAESGAASSPSGPVIVDEDLSVSGSPDLVEESSRWWLIWAAVPAALAALMIAGAVAWWMSVPRPYGFLYNDQGELIVDFSAVKRSPLARLLSGDRIPGKDLAVQGLEGVSFRFQPGRVDIISFRDTPTVRVNSQPLIGEAVVGERAWIGTRGRLYSFLASPLHGAPEPAPATD